MSSGRRKCLLLMFYFIFVSLRSFALVVATESRAASRNSLLKPIFSHFRIVRSVARVNNN